MFDTAVNQGAVTAQRILQVALDVEVDGVVGAKTIQAAHRANARVVKRFLAERAAAYARLMAAKPELFKFAVDWYFRVVSLTQLIFKAPLLS